MLAATLALRPAESCYGGLAVLLVSDTSWSMTSDRKLEASSDAELGFVQHLDTPVVEGIQNYETGNLISACDRVCGTRTVGVRCFRIRGADERSNPE